MNVLVIVSGSAYGAELPFRLAGGDELFGDEAVQRPGRSRGTRRATALPWSVTVTSSPSRNEVEVAAEVVADLSDACFHGPSAALFRGDNQAMVLRRLRAMHGLFPNVQDATASAGGDRHPHGPADGEGFDVTAVEEAVDAAPAEAEELARPSMVTSSGRGVGARSWLSPRRGVGVLRVRW